jgi:phosphinothricin acetyltransferase
MTAASTAFRDPLTLRDATEDDLPGILEIYNDAVANTTAIWNETRVDLENRRQWWQGRQAAGYPILVLVDAQGAVVGYASYGDWRPFDGYRHTVEHSVYIHPQGRGRGAGRRLMEALLERAMTQGKHVMVAGVDGDNQASIILHQKLGFTQVGQMPQVGCKFGRWLNLVFLQKTLDQRDCP